MYVSQLMLANITVHPAVSLSPLAQIMKLPSNKDYKSLTPAHTTYFRRALLRESTNCVVSLNKLLFYDQTKDKLCLARSRTDV